MKSVKTDKSCGPVITYPCLMIGDISGVVVLFTSPERGTIVHKGSHVLNIGNSSKTWSMCFFKPYNGSICLEN